METNYSFFYKKYFYNYNYFLCKILGKNNIYSN